MELTLTSVFLCLVLLAIIFLILLVIAIYMTSTPYPYLGRYESEKYFQNPQKSEKSKFPSIHDPPSMDLSVIVPAYNEEERLSTMMDEALEHLENRQKSNPSFSYEVIIVDDGSKDKTTQTALEYSKNHGTEKVRVLTLEKNRGKGGAIRLSRVTGPWHFHPSACPSFYKVYARWIFTELISMMPPGMLVARGKRLLFADADGASKFSEFLEKLEREMVKTVKKSNNLAVVCGSRAHLEEESIAQRSIFRTFLMHGFHFLVSFLCVKGIRDTQCGFKLFTRETAILLFSNLHVERWAFDVDMLYIAQFLNIPTVEVAIAWQEIEGSKMIPVWSWLQMGKDLLLIRLRYLLGAWRINTDPKSE